MNKKQQGLTYISWVAWVAGFGFVALLVVRLFPMYADYYKVKAAFASMATQSEGSSFNSRDAVWKALRNRVFYIDDVKTVKKEDFKFKKSQGGYTVTADYRTCSDIIYNISLCAHFQAETFVRGG